MEYYSVIKRGTDTCYNMDGHENIMLSEEASHSIPHAFWLYLYEMSATGKYVEIESRLLASSVWWGRGCGSWAKGHGVSFWGDENVLEGDGCTTLWIY